MSKTKQLTTDELTGKLVAVKKLHAVVLGIFVVIILVWIVLGYWQTNTPVFITTIAMAAVASAGLIASRSKLSSELKKRQVEAGQAEPGAAVDPPKATGH